MSNPPPVHDLLRPHENPVNPQWDALLQSLPPEAQADLRKLSDRSKRNPQWHLVEVPLGEYPTVRSYADVSGLQARLQEQEGSDVMSFVFYGERGFLSLEQPRYLLLPDGRVLPLFTLPSVVSPSELGFQGTHDLPIAPPAETVEEDAVEAEEEEATDEVAAETTEPEADRDDEQPSDLEWIGEPVDEEEEEEDAP